MLISSKESHSSAGQLALHEMLKLRRPLPSVRSRVGAGARRTRETRLFVEEYFPLQYRPPATLIGNLKFAFRHEPLDLGIIYEALLAIGPEALAGWVLTEPTSRFSRRAWFFYETFSGQTLTLEDAQGGNYVDALDEKRHFVAAPRNSPRHRVRDNLLGNGQLCPVLRRTAKLTAMLRLGLSDEAARLTAHYPPETLARAVNFLYTKETRSSFALEGETPSKDREERFLQSLHSVSTFDSTNKKDFIQLQNAIVDPRYAAQDWRSIQNFVGETTRGFGEYIHFVCPRPQDVPALMLGWSELTERLLSSPLDAVLAAAVSAFAFVFIHPFEDGNGRIHRYLIHYALARRQFSPPGIILPVSAAILRQKQAYDETLEAFSKPLLPGIEYSLLPNDGIEVHNETRDLYRFFDATPQAEFLSDRLGETIREDFREELDFLSVYDAAFQAVQKVIDMPDRRASLLVRLCLQNGGRLSSSKRDGFAEVTDDELRRIELALEPLTKSVPERTLL